MNITKYICHRRPDRSFFYKGHQFPVCARCTGFYITGIASIILLKLFPVNYNYFVFAIGCILLVPSAIDGGIQYLGMKESTNTRRLITGLLGGLGLILVYNCFFYMIFSIQY